jgi:tetraacyldisaccharide 4'-kinase
LGIGHWALGIEHWALSIDPVNPLSAVYGRAARLRRSWYAKRPHAQRRLERPVISVGNLVVGGSGKTPVVASLARVLLERGHRPAILSRGYARRDDSDGVVVVSDGARVIAPVEASGDEPQMLARALTGVPVLVCPDRYLAGRLAESHFAATVHILDDGFQHLQLARDVDLLIVSPRDLDDRVLPAGRLREPADAARVADAAIVHGSSDEAARVASALGVARAFTMTTRFESLRPLIAGESVPIEGSGAHVLAVAGIARPERFFAAVREQGFEVVGEMTFPDHHWFAASDLQSIARKAASAHADVVITTEKDAVRVGSQPGWAALPMEVSIEPAAAFADWIAAKLT